jgi:phenylpropionate dioxygenase-like ring-hydroxylating dioxygenase large terminal subunit
MDKSKHHLKGIRCEMWGEHIFINLSADGPDLRTYLGPVASDFEWASRLRPSNRRSRVIACNWRVAIEAFIEVYHITTIHPETVSGTIDYRGTVSTFFPNGHSRMIVPATESYYQPPPAEIPADWDEGRALRGEANVSYHIFPNLLAPASQTGYILMEFWPLDHNHTEIVTSVVERDWGEGDPPPEHLQRAEYFDVVLDEDTWNMEHIQHSLLSPSFPGPKCSYHEKRIYHLEEQVDRLLGEAVPAPLRVAPLLADRIVDTACAV